MYPGMENYARAWLLARAKPKPPYPCFFRAAPALPTYRGSRANATVTYKRPLIDRSTAALLACARRVRL